MTSPDAGPKCFGVRFERVALLRLRLSFLSSGSRLLEPAPNTYRGSQSERSRHSVSQKHIGSLARPIKFELALNPVVSGLEKGAELVGGAHFGAPQMFGGELGLQSKRSDAGQDPMGVITCFAVLAAITHLQISIPLVTRAFALTRLSSWLQLDGGITQLRSFSGCVSRSAPCRRLAPCSA